MLRKDKEEVEAIKHAKALEAEKAMYSVRRICTLVWFKVASLLLVQEPALKSHKMVFWSGSQLVLAGFYTFNLNDIK